MEYSLKSDSNGVESQQQNRLLLPMDENQHFFHRFDKLEANVERITNALVEIAKVEAKQASMNDLIVQQSAIIAQLSIDVKEGLKRSHERTDNILSRLNGVDAFITNAAPRILEIDALKLSSVVVDQSLPGMREELKSLIGWRNKIIGIVIGIGALIGVIQWFAVKDYDRMIESNRSQEASIRQMLIEIDRLKRDKHD